MIAAALLFIAGMITYSFIEYATHRWLLHGPLIKHHRLHHMHPNDRSHVDVRILVLAVFALWCVSGMVFTLGALSCWVLSSLFHWRLHVGNLTAPWVLKLRAFHLNHHLHTSTNYGVTNTLWDRLFGTNYTMEKNDER